MGLLKLVKALSITVDDLERQRLTDRFAPGAFDATPIIDIPARTRTKIVGEASSMRVVPHHESPWLEVTVDDGTGSVLAIFTGRRRIRGMEPGRALMLEGIARQERNRVVLLNPAYTLLP
ncbi:MAG: hypothetical protein ABWZ76_05060 [Acidimicrobiales bacterium]